MRYQITNKDKRKMFLKKFWILLGITINGNSQAQEILPFKLEKEWSCYASNDVYKITKPEKITTAPDTLHNIKRQKVVLKNGFCKQEKHFLLINEFHSDKEGIMYIRAGAEHVQLQLLINGKNLVDLYSSFLYNRLGLPGSHDIALPVKKGKNILILRTPRGTCYIGASSKENYLATRPTRNNFAAIQYSAAGTRQRDVEEMLVRNGVDNMSSIVFKKFRYDHKISGKKLEKLYDKYPVLEFYDQSLLKILKEIQETTVNNGAAAWLVYNMGYVIKTPESCFGIDIYHRLAEKLVPYLDFALVSHKHADHFDPYFCKAMEAAGKPVITNFLPENNAVNPPANRTIKDIKLEFQATDHNKKLLNFVMCSRITCGRGKDAPVIYHTGDSCNPEQLKPSGRIDIHILHPRVGLSVPQAARLLKPGAIWFSHLLEMGHCQPCPWRPIEYAESHQDAEIIKQRGDNISFRFPLWGEKIMIPPVK